MNNTDRAAVTIGNFDGIHKGHQKLLTELKKDSDTYGFIPIIYTFKDHPLNYLQGKGTRKAITGNAEKKKIFQKLGIDDVVFEDFEAVKDLAPEVFVKQILVDRFNMKLAIVGENNRFGKNSAGDARSLCNLGQKYGFYVRVIKPISVKGVVCSSSEVRNAVICGKVDFANELLGRSYQISGRVIYGKKLGRTYGFPTVNMAMPEGMLLPKYGVYATTAYADGRAYPAITNVGTTSFDKVKIERIETHLIGFSGDLYGKIVTVDFLRRMRGFISYCGVEKLEKQLRADREERLKITEGI